MVTHGIIREVRIHKKVLTLPKGDVFSSYKPPMSNVCIDKEYNIMF